MGAIASRALERPANLAALRGIMSVVLQQIVVDYLDPPALDAVADLVGVLSSTIFPEIAKMAERICQDEKHPVWDRWREYLDQPKTDILAHRSSRSLIIEFYRECTNYMEYCDFGQFPEDRPLKNFHQLRIRIAEQPKFEMDAYLESSRVHESTPCLELLSESGVLAFDDKRSQKAQTQARLNITRLLAWS